MKPLGLEHLKDNAQGAWETLVEGCQRFVEMTWDFVLLSITIGFCVGVVFWLLNKLINGSSDEVI